MKKIIFLSISIFVGIMVYKKNDTIIIPTDALRVRIIANSNSIEDLYAKKKLKEEIKDDLYEIIEDAKNSNDAKRSIQSNIKDIDKLVSSKTDDYQLNYGRNYFPKKVYKGVIYEEGEYDSLVITLGKGLGENWWCVLYPPLWLIDDNNTTSDVEYRSLVMDLISKK